MNLLLQDNGLPLYQQLVSGLKREIQDGRLAVGTQLPPSRGLADELGVSRNTVLNAVEQLKAEGYLETRRGAGTFVSGGRLPSRKRRSNNFTELDPKPGSLSQYATRLAAIKYLDTDDQKMCRLDFSYGRTRLDSHSLVNSLGGNGTASQIGSDYGSSHGLHELRNEIASHLRRQRGLFVAAEHIIITCGTQQSLDLCAKILLDQNDTVIMEEPHYESARMVFHAVGAAIRTIDVDEKGLVPKKLSEIRAKLLYVTPSHQFPTGAVLPVQRRIDILEWASDNNAYVIEDDYDSEFRYDVRPLQPMMALDSGDSVIYCGTFSKSLFPGLRLAYLIAPPALCQPLRMAKLVADRGTNKILQFRLASLLRSGRYARYVHSQAKKFSCTREILVSELHQRFGDDIDIQGANAGVHVLVWFKRLQSNAEAAFMKEAAKGSVAVFSVAHCYYSSSPQRLGLLLGYSAIDPSVIPEAVRRLEKAYRRVHQTETTRATL